MIKANCTSLAGALHITSVLEYVITKAGIVVLLFDQCAPKDEEEKKNLVYNSILFPISIQYERINEFPVPIYNILHLQLLRLN